ncbi:ANTAR domain-containing response regulator [Pseudochelatococcus sp. B33]
MTDLINDLRSLNVLVLHPRGADADDLIQQLNRIGCNVEAIWPLPEVLPGNVDVVFIEINEAMPPSVHKLLSARPDTTPTLIGLISYENPSVLQGLLDLRIHTVVSKPLRAFGIMSSMLMARRIWHEKREDFQAREKLNLKLEHLQIISEAKFVLMRHHSINEKDAYKIIRSHAMARRTSTIEIATAIINADGLLSNLQPRK